MPRIDTLPRSCSTFVVDAPLIGPREGLLIFSGVLMLVGSTFVASRVLRGFRHGFSIRLQLFIAIFVVATLTAGVMGVWLVDRLHVRGAILATRHDTVSVMLQLVREFAPRTALLVALLGGAAAMASFFLGRLLADPLESLVAYAEAVSRGERHAVLPPPVGRETRRLTDSIERMRRSLEQRHEIENFVADLSHELKNPVSAIRAATEVLLDGAAEDEEARPRFLSRVDEATRRLEVLLHDLLLLARLEAHGIDADLQSVALDEVVRESIEACAGRLESHGLRVDADLPVVKLHAQAVWLRRAVDNLLSNAVRYAPEGSAIEVSLTLDEPWARLRVRDHGPGVATAMRAKLFDRFATDRIDVDGTGLGLAIVRSVAEHHSGHVKLVEVSGPGACFELALRV